jgi:lipopolysaccharide transport system permease protein
MVEKAIIEPSKGWIGIKIRELFNYRELLYFLAWRDLKVRYKQTFLGVMWIVIQPFMAMMIFTFIFHKLAKISSGEVPYPLFVLSGILTWNYFSGSLTRSTGSLVGSSHLITKVYFPRLVIPISSVLTGWVDFGIASLLLTGLMIYYQILPGINILCVPFFLILAMMVALGVGLWLSALNVQYRDVGHLTPFLVQFWMFLTPVIYPTRLIPESIQWIYGINPMVGVIEGFRWALLGSALTVEPFIASLGAALFLCFSGAMFFKRMEKVFADVI